MKSLFLAVAILAAASAVAAPVDLDAPGVLDQLKASQPKHFEAVTEILRTAERLPCKDREIRALKARFDVRELECYATIMTSYPPKRRVSFSYDGTAYVAVVTLRGTEARVTPAREHGVPRH